jgi:putative metalloenzyme radical SAM/SPASM domain maturase
VRLGLEFVAMRENLDQLPGLLSWAGRNRFGFVIVTHMLPYDPSLAGQAAFSPSTDRALEIYRQWRDVALADGVDLRRYLDLPYVQRHFDAFARTLPIQDGPSGADARVAGYVRDMVADAVRQGVSLKLADLLAFDEAWLARVEDAFAQARVRAGEAGVELHLPTTVPTQVRHCDFVEEGSAFVSWNGDLHPCYFLWHGFQCHLGGLAKAVRPVCFGNVRTLPLLDAWNGAEWTDFRDGVLRYDFPFCYDCNLALCDYVEGGDFEQDCHVSTVPCATCLWCTGPFQCLS